MGVSCANTGGEEEEERLYLHLETRERVQTNEEDEELYLRLEGRRVPAVIALATRAVLFSNTDCE